MGDVMVGVHLGHSDHEMTEFLILGEVRRGVSRTATLDMFIMLQNLVTAANVLWYYEAVSTQSTFPCMLFCKFMYCIRLLYIHAFYGSS